MKRTLLFTAILLSTFLLHGTSAHAQFLIPIGSTDEEAIQKATDEARKTHPDAILKAVATLAIELPAPFSQRAGMSLTTGQSEYWAYSFYSPSAQQTTAVGVARTIIGYQAIPAPADTSFAFEFPTGPNPLVITNPYSASEAMMTRLATDTAFMRFRADFPNRDKADFAAYSDAGDTSVPTPGFPIDAPVWVVGFNGAEDSSMYCAVASVTGQTFCQRVEIPTLGVEDEMSVANSTLRVYPNPAQGTTRIEINAPVGTRFGAGAGASLFNMQGEKVLDLTGSMAGNAFKAIEFEAASLAPGAYFCVVQSGSWISATRVVVAGR